jgi:hypothetical protein
MEQTESACWGFSVGSHDPTRFHKNVSTAVAELPGWGGCHLSILWHIHARVNLTIC